MINETGFEGLFRGERPARSDVVTYLARFAAASAGHPLGQLVQAQFLRRCGGEKVVGRADMRDRRNR